MGGMRGEGDTSDGRVVDSLMVKVPFVAGEADALLNGKTGWLMAAASQINDLLTRVNSSVTRLQGMVDEESSSGVLFSQEQVKASLKGIK
jgi:hypothetical protein